MYWSQTERESWSSIFLFNDPRPPFSVDAGGAPTWPDVDPDAYRDAHTAVVQIGNAELLSSFNARFPAPAPGDDDSDGGGGGSGGNGGGGGGSGGSGEDDDDDYDEDYEDPTQPIWVSPGYLYTYICLGQPYLHIYALASHIYIYMHWPATHTYICLGQPHIHIIYALASHTYTYICTVCPKIKGGGAGVLVVLGAAGIVALSSCPTCSRCEIVSGAKPGV